LGVVLFTRARRERIEIDKFQRSRRKSQKRTGDALPKRVEEVIETGKALVTEAKGLGRGRCEMSRQPKCGDKPYPSIAKR
jgi:hypothetical protein